MAAFATVAQVVFPNSSPLDNRTPLDIEYDPARFDFSNDKVTRKSPNSPFAFVKAGPKFISGRHHLLVAGTKVPQAIDGKISVAKYSDGKLEEASLSLGLTIASGGGIGININGSTSGSLFPGVQNPKTTSSDKVLVHLVVDVEEKLVLAHATNWGRELTHDATNNLESRYDALHPEYRILEPINDLFELESDCFLQFSLGAYYKETEFQLFAYECTSSGLVKAARE